MDALAEAAELKRAADMIVALCNNHRLGPQLSPDRRGTVSNTTIPVKLGDNSTPLTLSAREEPISQGWKCIVPACTKVFATEYVMEAHSLNCIICPRCGHSAKRRQLLIYQHLLQPGHEECRLSERSRLVKLNAFKNEIATFN